MWHLIFLVLAMWCGHSAGRAISEGNYRSAGREIALGAASLILYANEVWGA